ncbi:MAG: protein kinase [Phycisphaerae bacterium]|nr:protein kinase [Phycisphaerae bacterium]
MQRGDGEVESGAAHPPSDGAMRDATSAFERAAAAFETLRGLGPSEREAAFTVACGGDRSLETQVRTLLAHHDRVDDPLDRSVLRPGVGTLIGRYRIESVLGEGGMGTVYRATQTEPVQREVALKVIKLGMDTRQVIRRFEAERQVLARMEHPNIAQAYDAGATRDGRPYVVMELVRGPSLTDYCAAKALPVRERVKLFLHVMSGVQHAHQKGVLHRDLKPSNILVSEVDGAVTPKVIDFGVAKALDNRRGDATDGASRLSVTTHTGHAVGTPDYMSPEQACGGDVDIRSDVYALGVILYELLAGVTPLKAQLPAGRRGADDDWRRRLLDEDPPRPSAVLGQRRTQDGSTDARQLLKDLRSELDWITLKALAREPERRYGTVEAFAEDLSRYLAGEAVIARPPSPTYLLSKIAKRHTAALVAGVAVTISLVAGLVLALYGLRSASLERDRAIAAGIREGELTRSLQGEIFAANVLRGRMSGEGGSTEEARALLWRAESADSRSPLVRWALREFALKRPYESSMLASPGVSCVRFLADSVHFIIGANDMPPTIVDARTGESVRAFEGPSGPVVSIDVSPDGRWVATGDADGCVVLWDLLRGTLDRVLDVRAAGNTHVLFCHDGTLVTGGSDRTVRRFAIGETAATTRLVSMVTLPSAIESASESPTGNLAFGGSAGDVSFVGTDGAVRSIRPFRLAVNTVAWSPDGSTVAAGSSFERRIALVRASTGSLVHDIRQNVGSVRRAEFLGPDELVYLGHWSLTLVDLRTETQSPFAAMVGTTFDISPDATRLISVYPQNADKRLPMRCLRLPRGEPVRRAVAPAACYFRNPARNGEEVVCSGPSLTIIDGNGEIVWSFDVPGARPTTGTASADGRLLAFGYDDRKVRVIDRASKKVVAIGPNFQRGEQYAVTFDARGERVAYATAGWGVNVLDVATGTTCTLVPPPHQEVLAIAFSPDGSKLAYSERGAKLWLLDLASGASHIVTEGYSIFSMGFSADSRHLVAGSWRGDVLVVDVPKRTVDVLRGHSALVYGVERHPIDEDIVATMGADGTVRFWHLRLGREVFEWMPFGPREGIRSIGFTADGDRLVVGGPRGLLASFSISELDRFLSANKAAELHCIDQYDRQGFVRDDE